MLTEEERTATNWSLRPSTINISSVDSRSSLIITSAVFLLGASLAFGGTPEIRIVGWGLMAFCLLPLPVLLYMKWRRNQPTVMLSISPEDPQPGQALRIRWVVPEAARALQFELLLAWDDDVPFDFDAGTGSDRRLKRPLLKSFDRDVIADGALEIRAPEEEDLSESNEPKIFGYRWTVFISVNFDGLKSHRSHAVILNRRTDED